MDKKLSTGIQVVLGFLLGIALNLVIIWSVDLISSLLPWNLGSGPIRFNAVQFYGLAVIGAAQLIWQLPAILFLRHRGRGGLALGVILAVSVTALLNATCWGLLWSGKIKIGG